MMRGRVMAWRYCRSRGVGAAMVVMMLVLFGMAVVLVESREMVAGAIELQKSETSSFSPDEYNKSVQVVNDAAATTTATTALNADSSGDGVGADDPAVGDVEAESPPAQRQRDRSLWGMSKRLVPTGPNPLHN